MMRKPVRNFCHRMAVDLPLAQIIWIWLNLSGEFDDQSFLCGVRTGGAVVDGSRPLSVP